MTLKPQAAKTPAPIATRPTWGEMADSGELATVARFECADETYSYPYHALSRWLWRAGNPETLIIRAGTDQVTINGTGLRRVRDTLDSSRLRVLRVAGERLADFGSDTRVISIGVEPADEIR